MTLDWRTDPNWRLVSYDAAHFPDGAPEKPTVTAELGQPDTWASDYRGAVLVATWDRLDPRIAI